MKIAKQPTTEKQELAEMMNNIGTSMLNARLASSERIDARPMMPVAVDDSFAIWFFTSRKSMSEIRLDQVTLTFADAKNAKYVSLAGTASLSHDRNRIEELWSFMVKPWFPGGKDDPDLALLRVEPLQAEVWDSPSSSIVRVLALAASAVVGTPVGLGDKSTIPLGDAALTQRDAEATV